MVSENKNGYDYNDMSNNNTDIDEIEVLDFDEEEANDVDTEVEQSQAFEDIIKNEEDEKQEEYSTNYEDNEEYEEVEKETEVVKEEIKDNSKENSVNTNKFKLFFAAMLVLLLAMISIRYIFFDNSDNTYRSNVISGPIKYKLADYNEESYIFKILKNNSIIDTINLRDNDTNKSINYEFRIEDGRVVASDGSNEYKISKISKANRLVVANMGGILEYSGVFVVTKDGKVYSISLYDDKYNLITECEEFEKTTVKYNTKSKIKEISYGVYKLRDDSSDENVILLKTDDNKQYILKK